MAERDLRARVVDFKPFQLEIPTLKIFQQTSVIFADVGTGRKELLEMHNALNTGPLGFEEPYVYHPHITLAQNIDPEVVSELYKLALRRWEQAPQRLVTIENITFVQNTEDRGWIDLAEYDLGAALAASSR